MSGSVSLRLVTLTRFRLSYLLMLYNFSDSYKAFVATRSDEGAGGCGVDARVYF